MGTGTQSYSWPASQKQLLYEYAVTIYINTYWLGVSSLFAVDLMIRMFQCARDWVKNSKETFWFRDNPLSRRRACRSTKRGGFCSVYRWQRSGVVSVKCLLLHVNTWYNDAIWIAFAIAYDRVEWILIVKLLCFRLKYNEIWRCTCHSISRFEFLTVTHSGYRDAKNRAKTVFYCNLEITGNW